MTPIDYAGPAGPGNIAMEKCAADNYFGCLPICLLSRIYGFTTPWNHPQKNDRGGFTEPHSSVPTIQRTCLIALIR